MSFKMPWPDIKVILVIITIIKIAVSEIAEDSKAKTENVVDIVNKNSSKLVLDQYNSTKHQREHLEDLISNLDLGETRRKKKKKDMSTSSSSKDGKSDKKDNAKKESLDLTTFSDSSSSQNSDSTQDKSKAKKKKKKRKYHPKSSYERRGWRKWHRKCTPCPIEMKLKWRHPRINWICGGYQRARRSFKSLCMMHYRNCQDGTMFVKLYDHRCRNDSTRGKHFFYDYKVKISGESSKSSSSSSESTISANTKEDDYTMSSGGTKIKKRKPTGFVSKSGEYTSLEIRKKKKVA